MDRSLLQSQLASILEHVAPATGAWSWFSPVLMREVAIVGTAQQVVQGAVDEIVPPTAVLQLTCATAALPDPGPGEGDFLVRDGLRHRVAGDPIRQPIGLTIYTLEAGRLAA